MDELDVTPRREDEGSTYEPPAVEDRSSAHDALVWTVSSPVVCL